MSEHETDRRRNSGDFLGTPRRSPVTFLILTVAAALLGSAAAAAVLGGGIEESTPHGQLLSALRTVADHQESHREMHGRFAGWLQTLELEEPEEIQLVVVAGDVEKWEAVARHPVGLTCTLSGRVEGSRAVREEPVCFTATPR